MISIVHVSHFSFSPHIIIMTNLYGHKYLPILQVSPRHKALIPNQSLILKKF